MAWLLLCCLGGADSSRPCLGTHAQQLALLTHLVCILALNVLPRLAAAPFVAAAGPTLSEGGFAPNKAAAASVLDVQEATDKKGKKYYKVRAVETAALAAVPLIITGCILFASCSSRTQQARTALFISYFSTQFDLLTWHTRSCSTIS
jgi:hypothetical protein